MAAAFDRGNAAAEHDRWAKPLILHAAAFANPAGGSFIDALVRLAANKDFTTAFLCPPSSAAFAWTHRLERAGVRILHAATPLDVARSVARVAPDVVHAHFAGWMLPAAIGAAAARARVAWHLHSGATQSRGARDLARRLKYAAAGRLVERFFCVSPDLVAYLDRFGIAATRITELSNGVDLGRFHVPSARERETARRAFGLAPNDRAVAFFGRDATIKGADRLAAALATMKSPPYVVTAAASPETLSLLRAAPVIDAGHVADIRNVLWACDALVLPSRVETVTYALLEARACGLPAVVSPLCGLVRVFSEDAGTAFVSADDPRELANSIDGALQCDRAPLDAVMRQRVSLDAWACVLSAWYAGKSAA